MAVWWLCGAAVLTFDRPFTFTGNGYFGCWIACLGSLYWFFLCGVQEADIVAKIQEEINKRTKNTKDQPAVIPEAPDTKNDAKLDNEVKLDVKDNNAQEGGKAVA
uniref:Uncharacterized protein n=2 Tax=Lotharella oceanica TaxID=641309 RepID=A0A7S2TSQ2_9EUKA|mmetsp:Transcript_27711/g.51682  ORF Transcript_27711/g.51682 Transcript_27711/m.51682 type:complete len:105 (+) Transcript_27711:254-568(+)